MDLVQILQCPDCSGSLSSNFICLDCGRSYATREAVLVMMPMHSPMPELPLYRDSHYLKYNSYLSHAEDYFYRNKNQLINWVQGSGYRAIQKMVENRKGTFLECGCGTGEFLNMYQNIDRAPYVMTDIDMPSLTKIKNKETLGGVIQSTNYRLPFKNGSFDVVLSHAQLEHLSYLDHALLEMKRVLKTSGTFLVSVPNEGGLAWSEGRKLTSAKFFSKKLGIDYIRANRIDHFNTVHQIDRALRRHFSVKRRDFFPFKVPSFNLNLTTTYVLRPLGET